MLQCMDRLDQGDYPIPEAELPEHYRREAERWRMAADEAPTLEQRIAILEIAEGFDRLAEGKPFKRGETG
jgi:hypothetical protein